MKVKIFAAARNDLIKAFHFYEAKRTDLGNYFLSTIYSEIETLQVLAGVHSKPYGNFHRLLSKKFPFAIYYTVNHDIAIVHAVVDCRRNPDWTHLHLQRNRNFII